MENESDDLSSIETRHRKEKKELQATIQSLKKTIKGDKTKKKEITAEISRLEAELEEKHKEELENCKNLTEEPEPAVNGENNVHTTQHKQKISKAQKRRDKKLQQEKEQAEKIRLQEIENLHGPRNIEITNIDKRLKEKQLMLFPIPSDGDCLYNAISHQLETIRQKSLSVIELRKMVENHIRQNKSDFLPFMSNTDTYEMLTDEEFDDYCDKIVKTKSWGGQLEIKALSNCLKCPINVIQATGPQSINQGDEYDGPPLIITYHRHMYQLGEHYNSTKIFVESCQDLN